MPRKPYAVLNYRRVLNFLCIKKTRTLGLMVSIFILHKGLCSYQTYVLNWYIVFRKNSFLEETLYSVEEILLQTIFSLVTPYYVSAFFTLLVVQCTLFYKHNTFSISILRLKFRLDILKTSRFEKYFYISKERACSKQNFKHKIIEGG